MNEYIKLPALLNKKQKKNSTSLLIKKTLIMIKAEKELNKKNLSQHKNIKVELFSYLITIFIFIDESRNFCYKIL